MPALNSALSYAGAVISLRPLVERIVAAQLIALPKIKRSVFLTTKKNLEKLSSNDPLLRGLTKRFSSAKLDGRADFRCTTPDYLPIAGAVPNLKVMREAFAGLREDAKSQIATNGTYLPNLYIHCGLGSRGLSYAPLCAQILAAEIARQPSPLEQDLLLAMHPARFIIRALKKKQL